MPTAAEKACLGCTLPICDDRSAECAFAQITSRQGRLAATGIESGRKRGGNRGGTTPEARAKSVATQRRNRLERMKAKLAERRVAKMWERREKAKACTTQG